MTRRPLAPIALAVVLILSACAGNGAPNAGLSSASEAADSATEEQGSEGAGEQGSQDEATRHPPPAAPSPTGRGSATPTPLILVTRVGSDYVLLLPREDAVPAGWAMSPLPDFQTRAPGPGDTYRFACRDLPARSIGIATVGYRHLDGLPSVAIEYVVYPSADAAGAALADMRDAAESCGPFTIGQGDSATAAVFAPLDFPALGDDRFAAALSTGDDTAGDLLIHVVKVRQGHVVIGISHTTYAGEAPPDAALTESLVKRAVDNLGDAPQPAGPSAN